MSDVDSSLDDSCPTDDCWGIVTWAAEYPKEDQTGLVFGQCGGCGTWVVYCPECEQKTGFHLSTQPCDGCGAVYQLQETHEGDIIGVHRIS